METTVYHLFVDGYFFTKGTKYMKSKKISNLTIGIIASVSFLLLYNISIFAYSCQTLRDDVIRLHILANSDSREDQDLKLKVRDAVLNECPNIFNGTVTPETAKEKIEPEIENIKSIAKAIIKSNGFNYNVDVYLDTEYFTTRVYESVTMPAGKYLALKIIIGNGEGKNWWCVMFPSLCLPTAEENSIDDVFDTKEKDIVCNTEKYEVRFKMMEYFEKIKNIINDK